MVFSSSVFLLVFLPVVLALYYLTKKRSFRNGILFVASLFFYAWGEPVYVALMLISVFGNWFLAVLLDSRRNSKVKRNSNAHAKLILILAIILNLSVIGYFKYQAFFIENLNNLFNTNFATVDLALPIGISFYTLQALSYIIDVYKQKVRAQKNPIYLGMYIACFPQLVAGPIVRYSLIEEQILNRRESLKAFTSGSRLFCVGLAKKVLLANTVAILATNMLGLGGAEIGAIGAWAGLLAFTFQIYFDFSGYSDMAIGLGKMFGFSYQRNFNYPYISKSATEFWRRWHISLSTFFRDYIYIPLGGSRVSTKRWVLNIALVWSLTGLWHGAAWNFVLWGIYFGVLLVLEKIFISNLISSLPKIIQHAYGILVFMFGWLLFWIQDLNDLVDYLAAMFGAFGFTGSSTVWELQAWSFIPVFIICIIASTPIIPWLNSTFCSWVQSLKRPDFSKTGLVNVKSLSSEAQCEFIMHLEDTKISSRAKKGVFLGVSAVADFALLAMLLLSIAQIIAGSFNPFIYFRF